MITINPRLRFPANWERTPLNQIGSARFSEKPLSWIFQQVDAQFQRLGATETRLTANLLAYRTQDGRVSLDETSGPDHDSGVAVYFRLNGQDKVLACDRWSSVGDNSWAIYRHIDAIRGMDRWGVGSVAQAFAGYAALPAPEQGQPCYEILGVAENASAEEIKSAFRSLAKELHPDVGGSNPEMVALLEAKQQALASLGTQMNGEELQTANDHTN